MRLQHSLHGLTTFPLLCACSIPLDPAAPHTPAWFDKCSIAVKQLSKSLAYFKISLRWGPIHQILCFSQSLYPLPHKSNRNSLLQSSQGGIPIHREQTGRIISVLLSIGGNNLLHCSSLINVYTFPPPQLEIFSQSLQLFISAKFCISPVIIFHVTTGQRRGRPGTTLLY